jgi:thioesterase domain-containing protein
VIKVSTFLAALRDRDIQVWVDGDQLRCSAPVGTLTSELRDDLRRYKREIMEFLRSASSLARQQRAIVPLQPRGSRPAAFAFGGHNGDVFCFRALARHLGEDQPFYGLQPPGLDGTMEPLARVEELASYFAAEIRAFQPHGPYCIIGFCAGGTIAFELARQLLQDGAALSGLVLFGAPFPTAYRRLPRLRKRLQTQLDRLLKHVRTLTSLPPGERGSYVLQKLRVRKAGAERPAALDQVQFHRARVERATFAALRRYVPASFPGLLSLILPCEEWARSREEPLRWRSMAGRTEEYFGPPGCSTDIMLLEPHAPTFARLFRTCRGSHDQDPGPAVPASWGGVACETA